MRPLLLVPLALVLVVALPLAQAHPVCQVIDHATEFFCSPSSEPCDTVAATLNEAGDRAAERCEDVL